MCVRQGVTNFAHLSGKIDGNKFLPLTDLTYRANVLVPGSGSLNIAFTTFLQSFIEGTMTNNVGVLNVNSNGSMLENDVSRGDISDY